MLRELVVLFLSTMAFLHQSESLNLSTISQNPCDPNPCQNGGRCAKDTSAYGFYCTCANGFYGYKCEKQKCPPRFRYRAASDTCVRLVLENLTWKNARKRCQEFQGSYLTIINNAAENNDHIELLRSYKGELDTRCNGRAWLGGQTEDLSCRTPYVWKPNDDDYLPMKYSFPTGQIDCHSRNEYCLTIETSFNYVWNDLDCEWTACFVCEYGPYE